MKKLSPNFRGFTLIELLTVIAIIGILAAIIIPTVGAVRTSAKKAKVKSQFSQWATAAQLFKQEYGYYPQVTSSNKINGAGNDNGARFIGAFTGRDAAGAQLAAGAANLAGNRKRMSFFSFADDELLKNPSGASIPVVVDAFQNSDIVMLIDANGDGLISGAEMVRTNVAGGNSQSGLTTSQSPAAADFPTAGIRAGVLFYSAGKGSSSSDIILSWK